MNEQERLAVILLLEVENELYPAIKTIYESEDMSNEEKQEAKEQLIKDFCASNHIETKDDVKCITDKLEKMKQAEERIKEDRKNKDFYDETR